MIELESMKTRISAPAHPFATGIGCLSGLVFHNFESGDNVPTSMVRLLF